jgi:hypothetical protein
MRKIKETFLFCCAAAILCSMMPEHCFAVKIGGQINTKITITITNQELKNELMALGVPSIKIDRDDKIANYIKINNEDGIKAAMKITEIQFKKSGFKAISAHEVKKPVRRTRTLNLVGDPDVEGTTWEVTGRLPGVNVSSDDGNCNITASPNCSFFLTVVPGLRTLTFSKDGFYSDPWQQNVQQSITNITATLTNVASNRGIRGQLTGVSPSTADCIEVTLTLEGNPCVPVVRSTNACLSNAYHFSFENLDTDGTYKIEVTDSNCTTSSSCTGIVIPNNNNQNCVINGVSCPQD